MPRQCVVCFSPKRAQADRLVAEGQTMRSVARVLGLPYDSLKRHQVHAAERAKAPSASRRSAATKRLAEVMGPSETFRAAFGFDPQPHQVAYMENPSDTLVLKGRQIGMSTAAAALAISVARASFGPDVVIVSPSMRQSTEVAVKARNGLYALGERLPQDSSSLIRLGNGSLEILSLAGTSRAVRGYSARLLIIDEAAFVEEATWAAARPMVSATKGRTIVQSTPDLPSGWYFDLWQSPPPGWSTLRIRSDEVESVDRAFLERERASMSPDLYAREYEATFGAMPVADLWSSDDWKASMRREDG